MSAFSAPAQGPQPAAAGGLDAGAAQRAPFPLARRHLPPELHDNLGILGAYAGALRAVADHPALGRELKEERLKALAAAIQGEGPAEGMDPGMRAALNLRHLLESRGLGVRDPWQMLQAAGLDLTKSRYPDWSDLLAWCRYWAAPMGRMVYRFAGADGEGIAGAESFAMGAEILYLIEQAATHHRWLDRVYLPERWFREAGCEPRELAAPRASPALKQVFRRTIGEARRLLDGGRGTARDFPTRRLRIAAATAQAEARSWARCLARGDPLAGPRRPGAARRLGIRVSGVVRGLAS